MERPCLVEAAPGGLWCSAGGFHVDPWKAVPLAVVTHAHSDHARGGCGAYLCAAVGVGVLRARLGPSARIEGLPWGERRKVGDAVVSLHPAGHILGSAQVRIEHAGRVTVVSGDYKTAPDVSCDAFEPVRCDCFITESTFGLPIYRWPAADTVYDEIAEWWRENAAEGVTSVLFSYPLGKAQRILAGLRGREQGSLGLHGAMAKFPPLYAAEGRVLADAQAIAGGDVAAVKGGGLVLAPESVNHTPWLRRLAPYALAFASGWMRVRGARRRRALDRGFVLSDHADWPGLLAAVAATGAAHVGVTHGSTGAFARYLREARSLDAFEVPTRFQGEAAEAARPTDSGAAGELAESEVAQREGVADPEADFAGPPEEVVEGRD